MKWRPRDPLEGRGEQTNGSDEGNMTILRDRETCHRNTFRIAELAKEDTNRKFSSIAHLLTVEALHEAFGNLRKDASAGVDHMTHAGYAVRENLEKLHDRLNLRVVGGRAGGWKRERSGRCKPSPARLG